MALQVNSYVYLEIPDTKAVYIFGFGLEQESWTWFFPPGRKVNNYNFLRNHVKLFKNHNFLVI